MGIHNSGIDMPACPFSGLTARCRGTLRDKAVQRPWTQTPSGYTTANPVISAARRCESLRARGSRMISVRQLGPHPPGFGVGPTQGCSMLLN